MKCLLEIYDGRKSFYQWDTNQRLIVHDDTITQVHFANKGMTHSLVTEVYQDTDGTRVCSVPDIILQIDRDLIAYAYLLDDKRGETLYEVKFHVNEREIPSDYIYNQDAEIDKLDDRITELERKVPGDLTVDERIVNAKNEILGGAPSDLDTLDKIAAALGDDPNYAQTTQGKLDLKVDKVDGKELSDNNFTDALKLRTENAVQYSEVDQTYSPESDGPQSGTAVKQMADTKVDKKEGYALSKNDFTDTLKDRTVHAVQYEEVEQRYTPQSDRPQSGTAVKEMADTKVDKVEGKQLSQEDFTTTLKNKLDAIEEGATNLVLAPDLRTKGKAAESIKVGEALDTKQDKGDYITKTETDAKIAKHDGDVAAHPHLIEEINKIKKILESPDVDLDTFKEIVEFIKEHQSDLEKLGADKVNYTDLINNLTTNDPKKALSGEAGVLIQSMFDSVEERMPKNKVVYQPGAPEDKTVLWVDTDDQTADGLVIPIDDTLTKTSWAAEAKATGDRINEVEAEIPAIDKTLTQPDQTADAKAVGDALATKQDVGDYLLRNEISDWAKQPKKPTYNYDEVGADQAGTAVNKVGDHNVSGQAHADIRKLITDLTTRINGILDSKDVDLDQLSEIVAYIKNNKDLIEQITTDKVSVSDIIDDLTHAADDKKPLSAKMGWTLKGMIDEINLNMPNNKVVVSDVAPENQTTLWIDPTDNGGDVKVYLDDTLSKLGYAAESQAVGKAIQELANRITVLENKNK